MKMYVRNRRSIIALLLAFSLVVLLLSGCSSAANSEGQDPKDIKVEISTEPVEVHPGQEVILQAAVTGLLDEKNSIIQFEIRNADNKSLPDMIEEVDALGGGQYKANYTFKKAAKYDIYIHIYNEDIHVTKKKQVEVVQ